MSDMIERVAEAIMRFAPPTVDVEIVASYEASARAAIEAMREPTPEVMEAIRYGIVSYNPDYESHEDAASNLLDDVIDAALLETESERKPGELYIGDPMVSFVVRFGDE